MAFYPTDEPSPAIINSGVYATIVGAIKKSAPSIPIAAVIPQSAVKGIEFGAYSLPSEVDWIGFDAYGCWGEAECAQGHCCWQNRTIPHDLEVVHQYAAAHGAKMVVVPDGVAKGGTSGAQPILPSAADQQLRATRDRQFFEWCDAEKLCVAMWVFLWSTLHTERDGWMVGVSDQTVLFPTLAQIGHRIKNRTVQVVQV